MDETTLSMLRKYNGCDCKITCEENVVIVGTLHVESVYGSEFTLSVFTKDDNMIVINKDKCVSVLLDVSVCKRASWHVARW